jgi:hypothetical protein
LLQKILAGAAFGFLPGDFAIIAPAFIGLGRLGLAALRLPALAAAGVRVRGR